MPVTLHVVPDLPDTVQWDFTGPWTWDEFYQVAFVQMPALLTSLGDPRVSIIINLDSGAHPPLIGNFGFLHELIQNKTSTFSTAYIVTDQKFMKFMFVTFRRLYPVAARSLINVGSLEEARQAIASGGASLIGFPRPEQWLLASIF